MSERGRLRGRASGPAPRGPPGKRCGRLVALVPKGLPVECAAPLGPAGWTLDRSSLLRETRARGGASRSSISQRRRSASGTLSAAADRAGASNPRGEQRCSSKGGLGAVGSMVGHPRGESPLLLSGESGKLVESAVSRVATSAGSRSACSRLKAIRTRASFSSSRCLLK